MSISGSCFLLGLFWALRVAELSVLGVGREGMDNTALGGSVVLRVVCHSELDWACLGCSPI